ncbi:MAG: 30S ribosomal protein S8 [Candidatus Woesearchaeota archaeon]
MSLNDPLSNVMSNILNAERVGKSVAVLRPSSNIVKAVLQKLQDNHFIGQYTEEKNSRGSSVRIELINKINKCGVIKPRFAVKIDGYEKFEKRFLLAKDFGVLIVSTNKGIMTHLEAKEKGLGGKLLAYCY